MATYRIEFSKDRRVAYVSHLEVIKVFSQALRRAGLPVAHTEGFNPRPRINFSSAVATGMTTLGECAEFELTRHQDPVKIERDLMALFPREEWTNLSHLLIAHGRAVCKARFSVPPDHPVCNKYGEKCTCNA